MLSKIKEVQGLVDKYTNDINYYRNEKLYNEHNCRGEFIDPFFKILGWDISNEQCKKPQYREVITENYSSETGRPDYSMTLNGVIKFHLEAKKPSVLVQINQEPAHQTRRYGWSSKLRISVLTNFEYLFIYDTSIPLKKEDDSNVAAIKRYHYSEYVDKFDEINELISKESVYNGSFEQNLDTFNVSIHDKGLQLPIDEYFLQSINRWRLSIGNYLYKNMSYSIDLINDYIQQFINQIIFLRICEDRKLPLYHNLKSVVEEDDFNDELDKLFKEADKKYNSGLFSGENIIFNLNNATIRAIVEELYFPKSPYKFNLIQPNVLGEIYELFLTERLEIKDGQVVLVRKNKKLDKDIVTTPIEIVRYMVNRTLEEVCKGKNIEEVLNLNIADIACGSGIFLIEVFDWLIKYVTNYFISNDKTQLIDISNNMYNLKFEKKKEILLNCIYGIDIDIHAVEVAKFNLILKLLEDETEPTLSGMEKLAPELERNILYGNSLVDYNNINYSKLNDIEKEEVVPFNWSNINSGDLFDVIIGNPPYLTTEDMKRVLNKKEFKVYKEKYETSKGQFDKYFIFLERGINKIKKNGHLSFIIPNKFTKIKAGEVLRTLLSENKYVKEYIDFGSQQLFKKRKKTTYSSILLIEKEKQEEFKYVEVANVGSWFSNAVKNEAIVGSDVIGTLPWALAVDPKEIELINDIYRNSVPLGEKAEIFNGIQTSAEKSKVYWFSTEDIIDETYNMYTIKKCDKIYNIEKDILRKYFKPVKKSEGNLGSYDICKTYKYHIFPYDLNGKLYKVDVMKEKYPKTLEYLKDNYDELKPKQIGGVRRDVPLATEDTWYQFGRDQGLTAFNNKNKLIVGILSKKPMYLYDDNDFIIASGGTAGYCAIANKEDSEYKIEYIQAYLTHPNAEKLMSIIGSDFEGEQYARGTGVLEKFPLKKLDFTNIKHRQLYDDVVGNARRIYEINSMLDNDKLIKSKKNILLDEKSYLQKKIEDLITVVFKI